MNDIAIDKEHLHYLEQLSEMYPTIGKASSEIINLQAILNLPKGTEHFVSDVHGEYEAFSHVLKNGSGAVRKKIDDVFGLAMNKADKAALATLIYYPREKMELIKQDEPDMDSWYKTTLYKLIEVCKTVSSKYTRSKSFAGGVCICYRGAYHRKAGGVKQGGLLRVNHQYNSGAGYCGGVYSGAFRAYSETCC